MSRIVLLIATATALNDVIEFGFRTTDQNYAASIYGAILEVTLWFNFTIYQFSTVPSSVGTWYLFKKDTAPQFTVIGSSDCHKSDAVSEAKIMFEYTSTDTLDLDMAKFTTKSGDWYGLDIPLWHGCMSPNPADGCPHIETKHIWPFDTSNANQYYTAPSAAWADGTNVYPQIKTCEPTTSPTNEPTPSPTNPSLPPTKYPTTNPSKSPTFHPSSRTMDPSTYPTQSPTNNPTQGPSNVPTILPSFSPTFNPTLSPTFNDGEVKEAETTISTQDPGVFASDRNKHSGFMDDAAGLVLLITILALAVCICSVLIYWFMDTQKRKSLQQTANHMNPANDVGINANEIRDKDAMDMKSWLDDTKIEEPQPYYDLFITKGYDTLEMIKNIKHESELNEIGINNAEHQTVIMQHIEGLVMETKGREIDREKQLKVEEWLKSVVAVDEYCTLFIENGYENMSIVKEIVDESELSEMGITNEVHRTRIMEEIKRLKHVQSHDSNPTAGDDHDTAGLQPDEFIVVDNNEQETQDKSEPTPYL